MKAKLRVTACGKRFERILEVPCLTPYLKIGMGALRMLFRIRLDVASFDHESGYLLLEPEHPFHILEGHLVDEKAFFYQASADENWHFQPNPD